MRVKRTHQARRQEPSLLTVFFQLIQELIVIGFLGFWQIKWLILLGFSMYWGGAWLFSPQQ